MTAPSRLCPYQPLCQRQRKIPSGNQRRLRLSQVCLAPRRPTNKKGAGFIARQKRTKTPAPSQKGLLSRAAFLDVVYNDVTRHDSLATVLFCVVDAFFTK